MALEVVKPDTPTWPRPTVSIVIPLLNEAENILPLYQSLRAEMDRREWIWEVIFVDDGSTDTTFQFLQELHQQDDHHVRVLRLRRNFGQTAALTAGFNAARGPTIVSLDGDLQNDPQDIVRTRREIGRRLRRGQWLACASARELLASASAFTSSKLAHQSHDRRPPPRLWLYPEGLSSRTREGTSPLWRDASVHPRVDVG